MLFLCHDFIVCRSDGAFQDIKAVAVGRVVDVGYNSVTCNACGDFSPLVASDAVDGGKEYVGASADLAGDLVVFVVFSDTSGIGCAKECCCSF